jgi:hypothetical protein
VLEILEREDLMNSCFTLEELLHSAKLEEKKTEIQALVREADLEKNLNEDYQNIIRFWDTANFEVKNHNNRVDSFLVANAEELFFKLEEHEVFLENLLYLQEVVSKKESLSDDEPIKQEVLRDEIVEWQGKIKQIQNNFTLWMDAQRVFVNFEAVVAFCQQRRLFAEEVQSYSENFKNFRKVMWHVSKHPKIITNVMSSSKVKVFENLIKDQERIKYLVRDYANSQRENFNRYYFLTDQQFLEFIAVLNSGHESTRLLECIFPGVSRLHIDYASPSDGLSQALITDDDVYQTENYDFTLETEEVATSQGVGARSKKSKGPEFIDASSKEGRRVKKILGLISSDYEYLKLNEPISLNDEPLDRRLADVEVKFSIYNLIS